MMTVDPQSRATTTWRTVVAILAAILLFAGGCAGDSDAEDEPASAETTTTASPATTAATSTAPTTTAAPATTTTQPVDQSADLSALREMVNAFYDAYNSGDAEAAWALLSPHLPEVSPTNLEFWIESLGEQVTAECVPSVDLPGGLACVERYRDQLHGPAGETIRATFHYFERDGVLGRLHDRFEFRADGECVDFRCPGDAIDTSGNFDFIWSYETLEADLFSWLEQSYPEVAQSIGEPANLSYSSGKPEAVAAALPYVDEFVAQSETWPRVSGHRDLAGMSALEAVLAEHEAFNSHDPATFEAWYGRPPDDWVAFFWGFDTRFESDCETTEDPDVVRCASRQLDGFYSKAGAVFEQTQLWTTSGNELILLHTTGLSSDWAWLEFEWDLLAWMEEAYPDVADQIFLGQDIIHSGTAAVIAMDYVDEFIEQSTEYPRAADTMEQMVEMLAIALFTE